MGNSEDFPAFLSEHPDVKTIIKKKIRKYKFLITERIFSLTWNFPFRCKIKRFQGCKNMNIHEYFRYLENTILQS